MNRYRRRSDSNQAEVVAALRAAGYAVLDLHRVGQGVPDLLVADGQSGHQILVEVKQRGQKLNAREGKFWDAWPGDKVIVYDGQDAVRHLEMWKLWRST